MTRFTSGSGSTRTAWLLPVAALLAVFVLRGTACKRKPGSAQPVVTPASKKGWITPLMTAPPPPPTPALWRKDITRIPTLPE